MKSGLSFLIFFLLILSCNKNKFELIGNLPDNDILKSWLPAEYWAEKSVVFKNEMGNEYIHTIEVSNYTVYDTIDYSIYPNLHFDIKLKALGSSSNDKYIFIYGKQTFDLESNENCSINVISNVSDNTNPAYIYGWSAILGISLDFENDLISINDNVEFHPIFEIFNRSFNDVYFRPNQTGGNINNQLGINSNEGIVTFKDENDKILRFDRFQD